MEHAKRTAMATMALPHSPAEARPWWRRLVRVGYAAKGVIYLLIGAFALQLALGDGGRLTDSRGVLGYITSLPFGTPLLAIIGVGLIAYALWQIADALAGPVRVEGAKGTATRAFTAIRGGIYGLLGWKALQLAMGTGSGSGSGGGTEGVARDALSLPLGAWMLVVAGLGLAAYGAHQGWKAWQGRLDHDMDRQHMRREGLGWVGRVGQAGMGGRAVVFMVMGLMLARAGADRDASDAAGTAEALGLLLTQPFGVWLLALTAAGLMCYGVWQLLHARYVRL